MTVEEMKAFHEILGEKYDSGYTDGIQAQAYSRKVQDHIDESEKLQEQVLSLTEQLDNYKTEKAQETSSSPSSYGINLNEELQNYKNGVDSLLSMVYPLRGQGGPSAEILTRMNFLLQDMINGKKIKTG